MTNHSGSWKPLLVWAALWTTIAVILGIMYGGTIFFLVTGFLILTSVCIFVLPPLMLSPPITSPEERLTLENDIRTTLIQAIAGAALIATLVFGWQQLRITSAQAKAASKQAEAASKQAETAADSAHDRQLGEQFTRAIDELSKKESMLGGIATLEQTATQESSDRYHHYYDPALRYLAAVARSDSSEPRPLYRGDPEALHMLLVRRPEVQAAMEAIDRLRDPTIKGKIEPLPGAPPPPPLELANADLVRAELPGAHLADIGLEDATLIGADLHGADLREAILTGADLRGANLDGASLDGGILGGADRQGAIADSQTNFPEDFNATKNGIIRAEITSPVGDGGQRVGQKIAVRGTYEAGGSDPPFEDAVIWVAVYIDQPGIKKFYPQDSVNLPELGEPWEIDNVGVGAGQEDKGKSFDVVAIIADRAIDQELRKPHFSGLPELPSGAIEMDRVTVVRR